MGFFDRFPFYILFLCIPLMVLLERQADTRSKPRKSVAMTVSKNCDIVRPAQMQRSFALEDFLQGPGLNYVTDPSKPAVCRIRGDYSNHFANEMQQLLRCTSFFLEHPSNERILVNKHAKTHDYLLGYISFLKEAFGVKEYRHPFSLRPVTVSSKLDAHTNALAPNSGYRLKNPSHAIKLREKAATHWKFFITEGCRAGKDKPVVGMANVGAEDGALQTQLHIEALGVTVKRGSLQGKSFQEQASFMASVDLLVTVSGSHLVSLPFMPTCGAVLETNVALSHFYSSLAAVSGLEYASADCLEGGVKFVREEIERWQSCCGVPAITTRDEVSGEQ